jgi:hypothetical protein
VGKRGVFNISRWQGVGASPCFWANDTAQIFWRKSPFFLKSIHQTVPLFKERVVTSMRAGYTFNAPQEKYCQLGELWLNQCGDTRQYCDTFLNEKKWLVGRSPANSKRLQYVLWIISCFLRRDIPPSVFRGHLEISMVCYLHNRLRVFVVNLNYIVHAWMAKVMNCLYLSG